MSSFEDALGWVGSAGEKWDIALIILTSIILSSFLSKKIRSSQELFVNPLISNGYVMRVTLAFVFGRFSCRSRYSGHVEILLAGCPLFILFHEQSTNESNDGFPVMCCPDNMIPTEDFEWLPVFLGVYHFTQVYGLNFKSILIHSIHTKEELTYFFSNRVLTMGGITRPGCSTVRN